MAPTSDQATRKIKFGTSGWRGIIGEDFTFANVRIAVQGIANYLRKSGLDKTGILVAYDTRFLSEKFGAEAAKVLSYNGIRAFLCNRDVPTPCAAFETARRRLGGTINFTASHNPPEWNGLKFSTATGAPALPDVTHAIEKEIHAVHAALDNLDVYAKPELIETVDPRERYLAALRDKIDLDAIRKAGLRIAIDCLYGTSREYLDLFLLDAGIPIKNIHNYRDPYFGGYSPECNQKNLLELRKLVAEEKLDIGLATDGDADRFGIIDERDRFVPANNIIALLALYLKRKRNIPGGLARSVATTHLIDDIAEKLDVPLFETPVGFKYLAELILENKIALGGEESAGLSIYKHLPEKDGILACLLVTEMVATSGKRISELTAELFEEFGPRYSTRLDVKMTPHLDEHLTEKLKHPPRELEGLKVQRVVRTDGVKLIFEGNRWLMFRSSGTEPVARMYVEACSPKELKNLVSVGRKLVFA